ncbi:hypothetical protein [Aneurinibacillus migulanus]|uniref:hypothetical protein n=1 Tax=Aneurinibacillus migulanus TaxID=47500 RepID=UPI000AAE96EF|nr:hypothetical protein [Aneurinibacillus migulanus]MCP1357322.1 hypothetical protein [Aneurinibacillus migulanus]MED0894511.1 hypothetical protein [Aneurinibacillus migulanus]MED1616207.1 hypothetical protein [Aneurinibacillus migulanus]
MFKKEDKQSSEVQGAVDPSSGAEGRLREQRRGNATQKFAVLFPGLFELPL